jgi:hypothetical protein
MFVAGLSMYGALLLLPLYYQQVGGSFGAAVLTVILELQLTGPGTATRLATGFDRTFWWAIGFTVIGALPAMLLRRPEPPKPAGSGK